MRNKRGQIFALILVFITLFLCMVVWGFYWIEQKNVGSSLVSPKAVLVMKDGLEIFEIREKALAELLSNEVGGEFGSDEYISDFREKFLDGVFEDEEMMEFIYDGLVFGGRDYEDEAMKLGRDFLDVNLYSDVVERDGKLVFSRNKMGKRVSLRAVNESRISFPVDFVYDFEKGYVLTDNREGS